MDSQVERLFAIGPRVTAELLAPLQLATVAIDAWDARSPIHYVSGSDGGSWLIARDAQVIARVAPLLGETYILATIDGWNSFERGATLARIRVERHDDGAVEQTWSDRRHPDLARAGMLAEVTLDWLREALRKLGRPTAEERGPTKTEQKRVESARLVIAYLLDHALLVLAEGSTAEHLRERTERVLYRLSTSRDTATTNLLRMLRDTRHVVSVTATAGDIHAALAAANYRRRAR